MAETALRTGLPATEKDTTTLEVANCLADAACDLVPVLRERKPAAW